MDYWRKCCIHAASRKVCSLSQVLLIKQHSQTPDRTELFTKWRAESIVAPILSWTTYRLNLKCGESSCANYCALVISMITPGEGKDASLTGRRNKFECGSGALRRLGAYMAKHWQHLCLARTTLYNCPKWIFIITQPTTTCHSSTI